MPDTITELKTVTIEGAVGAFDAFCEDIAGMFGISVEGNGSDQKLVTIKELKTDFKKITAVFIVESKGAVNGNYYIILDQDALFTLAGTFVMLPEKVIIQNRKTGREKEANEIGDAVGEVGNLLVGAWDKFFREEVEGHVHFLQTGTFIGKPWLKPEENIGLPKESELVAVKYNMTIEPFGPFVCMAAFPTSVFEGGPPEEEKAEEGEEEATEEAKEETKEEAKEEVKEEAKEENAAEPAEAPAEEAKEEPPAETTEEKTDPPAEETKPAENEEPVVDVETPAEETEKAEAATEEPVSEAATEEPATEAPAEEAEPIAKSATESLQEETATESTTENTEEPPAQDRPVTKVIEQMTQSPASLPGEITGDFLTEITAKNVMRTDIAWASQDDTVENVLTKMQQQNTGYALIGTPGAIEGIVSKSDIQGALSPYLQAIFSKWKRELDTATLQIKVRWIMSRPVHTIRPDATLAMIIETMCKHSVRSMPVADENGTVGIVTAYTIFNTLNSIGVDEASQQGQNTDVPALS